MEPIKNDILDGVEVEGLTQDQIDNMSNHELKEYQRGQSDEKIASEKKKREFSIVSTLFFLFCAAMLFINPIFTVYAAIAPAVTAIVFGIRTMQAHDSLQVELNTRSMLESFYEGNEL